MKNKLIKTALCLFIPLVISFALLMLFSVLIVKTNIPESFEMIFMIITASLCSVLMTVLFVKNSHLKPILCSAITFIIMLLIKIILSLAITSTVGFSIFSITCIAFTALFCFIGGLIGVNIKN